METLINSKYTRSPGDVTYRNTDSSEVPVDSYSRIVIEATNKVSPSVVQITTTLRHW